MYNLIIKDQALQEAKDAANYYRNIDDNLEKKFISSLEEFFLKLKTYPNNYSYLIDDITKQARSFAIKKFPFVVIYKINNDDVVILMIHNTHKNPINKMLNM